MIGNLNGITHLDAPGSPAGWALSSYGAAIHVETQTAVIADVHLGYEWSRGSGGDLVPAHSLAETLGKLEGIVSQTPIRRLIVAGDLVESPRKCSRTLRDVEELRNWLQSREITCELLRGNHDPAHPALATSVLLDGWTILHGDQALPSGPCVLGHHHPAVKSDGVAAPCFLVGRRMIVLPAFSLNAAGWNVLAGGMPMPLRREPLRCYAGLGEGLLDFGVLSQLKAKVARMSAGSAGH